MDLKLTGKTAIVTGSTAGIGLAIAERLAAEGVEVTITGRSQSKLDAAAEQIAKVGKVNPVLADPATAEGAAALIAAVPEANILVNNLGIYEAKAFTDISDADWHHLFEVNVVSGARLARHYFPKMLAKDWGRVIFISSESSLVIPEEMIHYGTTKTAQLAIARGLAQQTKGTGVTVNTVMPGPTRSEGIVDFVKSVLPEAKSDEEAETLFFEKMRPLSLIKRFIEADEIGAMVTFLASPLAAVTNGAAIRAEGGIVPTIA
ncbi:SDR family NAD(P)-dependent oxidoreductase [Sphingomonas oryzagri]|uniref:SDR family oxidoreductase n=1 Tax=Sphingomonas oryzagri TaxID=3042314 RepID=A0ABT6N2Y7_9SPHN|nr:SDR family oxidoreductase [Sphingomonas oryzagri]MDH7639653.1 SDR family oxidoreductase [Sphingomonas oryzagri]